MIFVDSVGVIVLFNQTGTAYFEHGVGNSARSTNNGDYTIVNYAPNGTVNWNNRFDADIQSNFNRKDAYLTTSDSGFFVCFSHEGSFDADLMSSNTRMTGDGGGINVSLIEYDFQLAFRRKATWPTGGDLIVQELAYNDSDQIVIAFNLRGHFDADPRPNDALPLSSPTGANNVAIPTNYIIGLDKLSLGVDWHQRIQTQHFLAIDEIVYDTRKDWWWVTGNYTGSIQTFDSPAYSHVAGGGNTPQPNTFFFAYDNSGIRSYTGALRSNSSIEFAAQFIPSQEGYLLMAQVASNSDLDFRLNQSLANTRNSRGVVISHYDTSFVRQWAHLRMERPLTVHEGTGQHAARLGNQNYLFGFSTDFYNSSVLTVGPGLDSSAMLNNVYGSEAILAQWRYCGLMDSSITYQEGIFYANDTTADLYEWVSCLDGSVLSAGTDPFWEPTYRTWAYLRMTKDQCEYRSECIVANDVGMEEWSAQLDIYPNPAQGKFSVEWQGKEPLELALYNSKGQVLEEYKLASGKHLINAPFPAGVYYLRDTKNPSFNLKLILN